MGYDLGFVTCPPPLGSGLYHDRFRYTFPTPSTAVAKGPFQYYLTTGTVHGTYRLSGKITGPVLRFHGRLKCIGGTGTFEHASGTGTETRISKDKGLHGTCTITARLTGINDEDRTG